MTAPLNVESSATEAQPEAVLGAEGAKRIEGRSLGQIAWMRLKRDRVALGGGVVIVLLILVALLAHPLTALFHVDPYSYHQDAKLIDPNILTPKGSFGGISGAHPFGIEPENGRDVFARIVYGAQITFIVAFLATAVSVVIGVVLGMAAGFFGGWVDWLISRIMDLLLAFPQLLFAIAIGTILLYVNNLGPLSGKWLNITVVVFIIGFFSWPYIGRIIRGQALSLREKEFVEAARSLGAGSGHILFKQVLPNLVAPIIVYTTLIIPTNILFEAALSFLGAGIQRPTPTWGSMLNDSINYYANDPTFVVIPGLALFITVMAFNLLGDGLRDALDPRANR